MMDQVTVQPSALLKQEIDADYPCVVRGEGVFLFDEEGRQYLDAASGAMTASVGHGVAVIADAMHAQARRLAFSYRTQFTNPSAEALATRLTEVAPTIAASNSATARRAYCQLVSPGSAHR